ncbi:hypothetical protein EDC63_12036 [Sulfurirhabdus autotrophica]|uniref:Uncharacterized protein n=1 Tax=Sulfurirhabdus autotrophica TaxID=1706046 RepID=A0A4R3XUC4_9PROT|nr:hypothetical protein EDC63_12036 [Sulfurirhabdus autotrophica]
MSEYNSKLIFDSTKKRIENSLIALHKKKIPREIKETLISKKFTKQYRQQESC